VGIHGARALALEPHCEARLVPGTRPRGLPPVRHGGNRPLVARDRGDVPHTASWACVTRGREWRPIWGRNPLRCGRTPPASRPSCCASSRPFVRWGPSNADLPLASPICGVPGRGIGGRRGPGWAGSSPIQETAPTPSTADWWRTSRAARSHTLAPRPRGWGNHSNHDAPWVETGQPPPCYPTVPFTIPNISAGGWVC